MAASSPTHPPRRSFRLRWFHLVFAAGTLLLVSAIGAVLSFLPGRDSRHFTRAVLDAMPSEWDRRFELGVGRIPVLIARTGLQWVDLEPEVRSAIRAARCADVAVFQRRPDSTFTDQARVSGEVRTALEDRGWSPVVTVADGDELVMVFAPEDSGRRGYLRMGVMVIQRDNLVVAVAEANLDPLINLARTHMAEAMPRHFGRADLPVDSNDPEF